MGYQRVFESGVDDFNYHRVDIYTQNELRNALFIDSLFNVDYPDIYIVNNGASKGIKLHSAGLSIVVDKYYDYKSSWRKVMVSDTLYSTFSGELKKEMFETEKQKLSFLLGAFARYGICETKAGKISDDKQAILKNAPKSPYIHYIDNVTDEKKSEKCIKYCFALSNASKKAEMCAELLRALDTEDVEHVWYKNHIPVPHFVIFKPSEKLQEVINDAEILKQHISEMNINDIEFTPNGAKYKWVEPEKRPPINKKLKTN